MDLNLQDVFKEEASFVQSGSLDNTLGIQRKVHWICRPANRESLKKMLQYFHSRQISFHVVSTGKNWGLGSQLPAQDHVVILSLERLNRILSVDESMGVITIEAGVTQEQVANFLSGKNSKFCLDVTGSGRDTSLIGNALERGISYRNQRSKQVLGLTALTVDGREYRSGYSHSSEQLSNIYPQGIGPDISGLFFQSSFGIVVEATFSLVKVPERIFNVTANIEARNFSAFLDQLIQLLQDGTVDFIPHIANKNRFIDTAMPLIQLHIQRQNFDFKFKAEFLESLFPGEYIMNATVSGPAHVASEKLKVVRKMLSRYARVTVLSPLHEKLIGYSKFFGINRFAIIYDALKGLRELSLGVPSNDALLVINPDGKNPDLSSTGFMYVVPIGPLNPQTALDFIEFSDQVTEKYKLKTAMTLNPINPYILECVFSIFYAKNNSEEMDTSQAAANKFLDLCDRRGYYPYRLPTALPNSRDYHSPAHAQLVNVLKDHFDPKGIVSPGRYM